MRNSGIRPDLLAAGGRTYDDWRLRTPSEDRAEHIRVRLVEWVEALQAAGAAVEQQRLERAHAALQNIRAQMGTVLATTFEASGRQRDALRDQLAELRDYAVQNGLTSAAAWIQTEVARLRG